MPSETARKSQPPTALRSFMMKGANMALAGIGSALVIYHAATVWTSFYGAMKHYTIHLTAVLLFAAIWIFRRAADEYAGKIDRWSDLSVGVISALFSFGAGYYLYTNAETLEISQPFITPKAIAAGCLLVIAVLLITWRLWGAPIAIICLCAGLYLIFGHWLPEPLTSRKQPLNVAISFLGGIGGPRGVLSYMPLSADMIFLLLVYGGLLHGTRVIDMFGELGAAIGNVLRGGVAYSAIVASTLIGMVTGQAVSNIALSGVMTIPAMKKNGFSANEAGAIEVMASTGSQLLPPIMGLGAFLMAVILGVSYIDIVIAGFLPGVLYMIAVTIALNSLIGQKHHVDVARKTIDWAQIRWILPSFIASFAVLIVLLVLRYSPPMAGFWGGLIILALSFARPAPYRPRLREILDGFMTGLTTAIQLAVILAAIGIVVQTLTTTGLGVSAGTLISHLSGDNTLLALAVGLGVSLIVGMGLPTPAAYALIAIIVVPSLIDVGLSPLVANMYGFYFAIFSALTPPVAVGVLVAVRISGGSFMGSAWESAKLGGVAILVPFMFVSFPSLLDPAALSAKAIFAIIVYLCSALMIAGALYGALSTRLSPSERLLFALFGPICLAAFLFTHQIWIGLLPAFILIIRWFLKRKRARSCEALS